MKTNLTLSLSALILSTSLVAAQKPVKTVKPAVSAEESIRKAIDNICGDTWCEGDFQFKFERVVLDSKANQFTVDFVMNPYLENETVFDDNAVSAIIKPGASVQCVVKGYSKPELILDSNGSLNWTVYETLSSCVNSLEARLVK